MIFDKIKAHGAVVLAAVLTMLLLIQTLRLHGEQVAHQKLIADTARADRDRATAVLKDERQTADKEFTHTSATQENADAFTISQPARDAIARADVARHDRLRLDAERRAATYHAQAQAGAAACSDLADRHAALDAHVVRGVEVVAGLRGDLVRRDAEVALLRRQVGIERALLDDPSHE